MVQYQSFPNAAGDSRTLEKLKALQLPDLEGRTFLDVGCNEGFFCGYARFAKAARVVGIDASDEFIRRAQARFPDCEFLARRWDCLPGGEFDVILLASALHYADDQPALIDALVGRLTSNGVLILELGVADSDKPEWICVKRGIDQRQFPSMSMLAKILEPYAWKWMGPSVRQSGDPVPRHVIHVSRRRPVAYLLMQPPASGKSSIARRLFQSAGVRVVSADAVLLDIAQGKREVPERLHKLVAANYSATAADQTVRRVFAKGLGPLLVRAWLAGMDKGDMALDGFVPVEYQSDVVHDFHAAGYMPINMVWQRPAHALPSKHAASVSADAYFRALGKEPPPAPAGEGVQGQGSGYVDSLVVAFGAVEIRGWAVDENGDFPAQLVVGIGAERDITEVGAAVERKDVQKHLGLKHAHVGYALKVRREDIGSLRALGERGFSVALMSGKLLRLSPAVRNGLAGVAK